MKKRGYTKPEIVIAAIIICFLLTILLPPLFKNTNASQFKTSYKKSLSAFKHAITMNIAIDDFDFRKIHNSSTPDDQADPKSFATIITERMDDSTEITDIYFSKLPNFEQEFVVIGDHTCTEADMKNDAKNFTACKKAGGVGKTIENVENKYVLSKDNFIVYRLDNDTAIGYNKHAQNCKSATQENCVGFIDANGAGGPNKITECDNKGKWETSCVVSSDNIQDIYPVVFYNQTIEPATVAGKSILDGLKIDK